ncbi:PdaC/SigV domain-containing protein [Pseudoneobacillus sp. C159]
MPISFAATQSTPSIKQVKLGSSSYPQLVNLSNKKIMNDVNKYLKQLALEIDREDKQIKLDDPECKQCGNTSVYKIMVLNQNILSLKYVINWYTGGAQREYYYDSYNVNLKTGKRIYLTNVLDTKTKM